MKRVCISQNSMTYGGTDTFVINLCKGLIEDGYEVTVVLSVNEEEFLPREQELLATKARVLKTCQLNSGISKLRHLKSLFKELKTGQYDVFQSNIDLFNGPQMFVAYLAGIPIRECHSHNSQQARELNQGRTISVRIYQTIMRWLCWKFSNRRCGCSEMALNFLFGNKWKKDSSAKIIHNGIDLGQYQKIINVESKKMELGINNRYTVCTIGRISFQKNPDFLLDIFFELSKLREDVDLVWCGKGEDEKRIYKKIDKYSLKDRVKILGSRNDISEILAVSDLFLLPSRFEGLGIVLVEAQAAGVPCVVSDVIPREVDCGLCLPLSLKKNAKYWASETNSILDQNRQFILDKKKLERFSVETMVSEMEEVFE